LKPRFGGLMYRIRANRDKATAAVQSAVESVDPALLPSLDIVSLEDGSVALQRAFYRILAGFAGILTLLSLTLAGVGIYGVMAFLVSQRTREIGIRMALGATSGEVVRNIVVPGLWPVLLGTLAGLAGAAWAVSLLRANKEIADGLNLFSRTFNDPALYGELALVFIIPALASFVPAKRAARVDPMVALRHD
jgi:ABC-type antimicrobial peptide transport system permease subunit